MPRWELNNLCTLEITVHVPRGEGGECSISSSPCVHSAVFKIKVNGVSSMFRSVALRSCLAGRVSGTPSRSRMGSVSGISAACDPDLTLQKRHALCAGQCRARQGPGVCFRVWLETRVT